MTKGKQNETITSGMAQWIQAVQYVASSPEYFCEFRSKEIFLNVVEGSPSEAGLWNLIKLLPKTHFQAALPLIQTSDKVGNPRNLIPFRVGQDTYKLNPTTLRYVNNCVNIIELFGPRFLENRIFEIGAGYGGECKIINDFSVSITGREKSNYFIYDLPDSEGMIKRFLSTFGYSACFLDMKVLDTGYLDSFVISNGALSEMRGETLEFYIENVIAKCSAGYFMTNFESHSLPFGGISTDGFVKKLQFIGKHVVELPGHQYLTNFDVLSNTRLLIFGV